MITRIFPIVQNHPNLSYRAKAAIANGKNLILVSAAVIWEIRIKHALGKLEIPENFRQVLDQQDFELLDITVDHAHAVGDLEPHHRLVAQAKVEGLTLVTHDNRLIKYKIPILKT